ncbi:hypothetical protein pipiens_007930 [Culex pipiens pipiens]|uniref:Uncharacterized protein n=3 Tax=Culex pipiens TaxID=7175 RepID=A0ABD1DJB6_CULPP
MGGMVNQMQQDQFYGNQMGNQQMQDPSMQMSQQEQYKMLLQQQQQQQQQQRNMGGPMGNMGMNVGLQNQRMMRPVLSNNPGLRHLLQQQPNPQFRQQMANMGGGGGGVGGVGGVGVGPNPMGQMGGGAVGGVVPQQQQQQQRPNPNQAPFDDANFDFM